MADTRFFNHSGVLGLRKILDISKATVADHVNLDVSFGDVAALDKAGASHVSFLDNIKYKQQFSETKAGACFVHPDLADLCPAHCVALITYQPYKAYALTAQAFYSDDFTPPQETVIEAGAIVRDSVKLGKGCIIKAGAVIEDNVELGDHVYVGSNAVISHALIGNGVRIYPGAKIGQDGFGFAIDPTGFVKVPQLGRVVIGDNVEIGANTAIDRGAGPDTVIGAGTWIDNLVQIGHNVKIGMGCVIVSQTGISGSTEIGDFVMMGGQSGVAGHLKIGTGAKIAAQSGVMKHVGAGEEVMGSPAMPMKQYMRQVAALKKMTKVKKS